MQDDPGAPHDRPAVVVGVRLDTPAHVVTTAADLARRYAAELVCVHVDPDLLAYPPPIALSGVGAGDGLGLLQPEVPPIPVAETEGRLRERLEPLLGASGWRVVMTDGDPADALAREAERCDAALVVVGTMEGRTGVRDLLGLTVAAHLARHQHRPVVVVPTGRGDARERDRGRADQA